MATEKLRQFAEAAASAAISLSKPNYFDSNGKKGENFELRNDLNSEIQLVRKEAVKKVIANMTVGKDVSSLFADVLKCIQTDDMEMKKLVYLYLMNYAKSQPELAILAINTFCKDTEHKNPLIRALSLRTMGCIRLEQMIDYLCEPLSRCLQDPNPYVRKTAAVCAAKVFDLSPEIAEDFGYLQTLQGMLSDSNPMVVANVVAALLDIQYLFQDRNVFEIDSGIAKKLLESLADSTEWGQIAIMDAIVKYEPESINEVEFGIEKVTARLQHSNPSVVLSAVKLLLKYLEYLPEDNELLDKTIKKLSPPLMSLLSSDAEIAWVVLQDLQIILQTYPNLIQSSIKSLFCKYNDPIYVKIAKLDVILLMADDSNVEVIINELVEYTREVDISFVRRCIWILGQLALKVPSAAGRVVTAITQLLEAEADHIIQEAIIVMQAVFRSYPEDFTNSISLVLSVPRPKFEEENRAKAAFIWIVGEYGHYTRNEVELLSALMANFNLETSLVQSELMTACFKRFLENPGDIKAILNETLELGIKVTGDANIRDRAVFLKRLMSMDMEMIREVISKGDRPIEGLEKMNEDLLTSLMINLSTVAAVLQEYPQNFESVQHRVQVKIEAGESKPKELFADLLDLDLNAIPAAGSPTMTSANQTKSKIDLLGDDLLS